MTEKEREEGARKAAVEADIRLVLKSLGKKPVMKKGQLVHPDFDDLVIEAPDRWVRTSGKTEKFGSYTSGTALHYMIEYEGMGFASAVEKLCEVSAPQLLPSQPIARMKPEDRIELIRKQSRVQEIIEEQLNAGGEEGADAPQEAPPDDDYPEPVPHPNTDPDLWESAMQDVAKKDGIDRAVFDYMHEHKWAFVGDGRFRRYLLFPGRQPDGKPGFFFVRTLFPKRYSVQALESFIPYSKWAWHAGPEKTKLAVYDNPMEAAAHMSILYHEQENMDAVKEMNVLAISASTDIPLLTYLRLHDVLEIDLHLSRTENGESLTRSILEHLKGAYEINRVAPEKFTTWTEQARSAIPKSGA